MGDQRVKKPAAPMVRWETMPTGAFDLETWARLWVAALLRREGYPSLPDIIEAA